MQSKTVYLIFSLLYLQINTQEFISRCPKFFKYDDVKNEEDRWYGELILSSEYILSGYWIELKLSNDAELLGIKAQHTIISRDNKNYLITTAEDIIEPGNITKIPIFVKYNELEPIPEVESIYLNGRELCPEQLKPPVGISPCPGIFSYDVDQHKALGRWFGTINLNLEYNLKGVYLEVHLDKKADFVGNINYHLIQLHNQTIPKWGPFGKITSTNNQSFKITNSKVVLTQGQKLSIPFFVKYKVLSEIPLVNAILLNGRVICQKNFTDLPAMSQISLVIDLESAAKAKATTKPSVGSNIPDYEDDPEDTNEDNYNCGIQELGDKIIHGAVSSIEKFPWHGGIFKKDQYVCGMSLISRKHALSAAHCFYEHTSALTQHDDFSFRFGMNNLSDLTNKHIQSAQLSVISIYPQYKYHTTSYDIAIVSFTRKLHLTQTVKPVCLWSGDTTQHQIEQKTGVVAGFGQTENKTTSNVLREAELLTVDSETCREADMKFYSVYLTSNSFCAGNVSTDADQAVGPCIGDSGGGMFFKKPGTEIWEIRGITSTSRPTYDHKSCVPHVYTIFTDVAKFRNWISEKTRV